VKHFWITVGNSDFDRKRLGLQRLQYPLVSYAPATALRLDIHGEAHLPNKNGNKMGIELAFRVDKDLFMVDKDKVSESIQDHYLCVSFYDRSHLHNIENPTERDVGVCEYYARWNDGANLMRKLEAINSSDVGKPIIEVQLGGETYCFEDRYLHTPRDITSFLASFTPVNKMSYITMGLIGQVDLPDANSIELIARSIKNETFQITI
jgi:hypothetical protein